MYQIIREIYKSPYSEVYEAKKNNSKLRFILKCSNMAGVYKWEEKVATELISGCKKTVVVPVDEVVSGSDVCDKATGIAMPSKNKYMVMHFKKNTGKFLSELIDCADITVKMALKIVSEILDSEIIIRQAGYLHGDIHPNNIFMDGIDLDRCVPGNALFIDLATACKEGKTPKHKYVSRTYEYSAPEIMMGVSIRTVQSEIYSITMLLSKLLEKAGSCFGVEKACDNILLCGLDQNPEYRYRSLEDMKKDVDDAIEAVSHICSDYPDYIRFFEYLHKNYVSVNSLKNNNYPFVASCFRASVNELEKRQMRTVKEAMLSKYLWELIDSIADNNRESVDAKLGQQLAYAGIAIFNNNGNSVEAQNVIKKYHAWEKKGTSLNDEYSFALREAITYADGYRYDDALNTLKDKTSFLFGLDNRYLETAKAISSIANVLAKYSYEYPEKWTSKKLKAFVKGLIPEIVFTGNDPVVDCYSMALSIYDENSADYKITLSYLLQYLLTKKDKEQFESYICKLFKEGKPEEGLGEILISKFFDDRSSFNRLIYLKAIYYLYPEIITEDFCHKLGEVLLGSSHIEHPIQQLCQYGGLIVKCMIDKKKEDAELTTLCNQLFKNALSMRNIKKSATMDILFCMTCKNMWNQQKALGADESYAYERLLSMCKKHGWTELEKKLCSSGLDRLFSFDI